MSAERLGGYNEQDYNEPMYNDNDIYLSLLEAITSTDTLGPNDVASLKVETLTLIDNLQKYFDGQIFMDFATPTDVLLNEAQIAKLETLSTIDIRTMTVLKELLETMTLSDVHILVTSKSLLEATVLVDVLTKFISNKGLSDSIRLQDWLSIRKNPAEQTWSN